MSVIENDQIPQEDSSNDFENSSDCISEAKQLKDTKSQNNEEEKQELNKKSESDESSDDVPEHIPLKANRKCSQQLQL